MKCLGVKAKCFNSKSTLLLLLCYIFLFFCRNTATAWPVSCSVQFNQQVTDSLAKLFVESITIEGNTKTQKAVITRELLFSVSDSILACQLPWLKQQSESNLLGTSLFNYVNIKHELSVNGNIAISVKLEERWYLWPSFKLAHADRNFSSWIKRQDWDDTRFGIGLQKYNFRGFKETLSFAAEVGYEESLELHYTDLTIGSKRRHILSFYMGYVQRHDLFYKLENNKLVQLELPNQYAFSNTEAMFRYAFRNKLYAKHSLSVQVHSASVADTILQLSTNYFPQNKAYGNYADIEYLWEYKKRDSKYYPLNGVVVSSSLAASMFNTGEVYTQLRAAFYKYHPLGSKYYVAVKFAGQKSFNMHRPMVLHRGLGYEDDLLYGYEHYVVDGQDFAYIKSGLKRCLVSTQKLYLPCLPIAQLNKLHYALYANLFADCGIGKDYTSSHIRFNNSLSGEFLYSFGAGLDFVTYYDKVLKVNIVRARHGKTCLFVHFKTYL